MFLIGFCFGMGLGVWGGVVNWYADYADYADCLFLAWFALEWVSGEGHDG